MKFRSFLIGGIAMLPWMTICSLIGSTLNSINEASSNNSNLLEPLESSIGGNSHKGGRVYHSMWSGYTANTS